MKKERLPRGFWRAPNGSLRVLIRVKGWPPAVRTFKLVCDTAAERRRQLAEAEEWAVATRRKLYVGQGVASTESREMTLADALRRYRRDGLSSRPENKRKDERRIDRILRDPISERRLTSLSLPDLAAYRDILIDRDYSRRIKLALKEASGRPGMATRRARLTELLSLRYSATIWVRCARQSG